MSYGKCSKNNKFQHLVRKNDKMIYVDTLVCRKDGRLSLSGAFKLKSGSLFSSFHLAYCLKNELILPSDFKHVQINKLIKMHKRLSGCQIRKFSN